MVLMQGQTIEIKIRQREKGGWNEHLPEGNHDDLDIRIWLDAMLNRHVFEENSTHQVSLKVDGGYARKKKDGARGSTMIVNIRGVKKSLYDVIGLREKANPTRLDIIEEEKKRAEARW